MRNRPEIRFFISKVPLFVELAFGSVPVELVDELRGLDVEWSDLLCFWVVDVTSVKFVWAWRIGPG